MAERLKGCWFKFMAVFCSLYLAPLSNLFTKVFAFIKPAEALAVTVQCSTNNGDESITMECAGNFNSKTSFVEQEIVECLCPTDASKVLQYKCYLDSSQTLKLEQLSSICTTPSNAITCDDGEIAVAGKCYPKCISDPTNGTGYVATAPAF